MLKKNLFFSLTALLFLSACSQDAIQTYPIASDSEQPFDTTNQIQPAESSTTPESDIPAPIDLPIPTDYIELNDNIPTFSNEDIATTEPYTRFSPLDEYGRTGLAQGLLDYTLMPDTERGSISSIYPSGWDQGNYDAIENGGWLYNRSHLIGYQLTGENDPENLMTGTRQFNVDGMLPFENYIAQYIESSENPVLYRVTPIYEGDNLLAHGIQMEGYSPYDDGEGIQFNVFIPNQQNGIDINYSDGSHRLQ